MIIFSPRLKSYQFSQPPYIFLIYSNTMCVFSISILCNLCNLPTVKGNIWIEDTRGVNKFVKFCIFLCNSKLLFFSFFSSINLCQLNNNSRSVTMYIFLLLLFVGKPIPIGKNEKSQTKPL